MKTVANCANLGEAQTLKMILESEGVESFIPDELTASIAPHHFFTSSGVRLQVADEKADEAVTIIEDVRKNQ